MLADIDSKPTCDASASPTIRVKVYFVALIVVATGMMLFDALVAGIQNVGDAMDGFDDPMLNSGDMAWILVSSALVMLMTPGLGFFYGGMVRKKNIISTLMQSFICLGVITVLWIVYGFSLCFGESKHGVIGSPHTHYFYKNVGAAPHAEFAATIPFALYSMFQLYFAVITPALISGSISERIKFHVFVVAVCLWFTLVYCPLAHITWHPEGILKKWGVLDFAGGTVVHMSSGISAMVAALIIGPRVDDGQRHLPANIPFVILGTALLWFGWFGFNAGSAGAANATAVQAFVTTNTSAATAMLTWVTLDHLMGKKVSAVAACSGAVVGLVVITPACGYVTIGGAMCIGTLGAIICNFSAQHFKRSDVDDTLDAFSCHGVGGITGMLLTGCFATPKVAAGVHTGLFYGGTILVWRHIVAIIGCVGYIATVSFIIFKFLDVTVGLRVTAEEELVGVDQVSHGESHTAL